jgi:16S rRNA (cytosine1402-N4)-methyltransferase
MELKNHNSQNYNSQDYSHHKPVLLEEVIQNLQIKDQKIYVDGTFGAGGYSKAILETANCQLYSFDRDENVKKFSDKLSKEYPNNFHFINDKFSNIQDCLNALNITEVDGIVVDLGVSSMQLDEENRGFSFNSSAKLDMRMGKSNISAYEVVNEKSQEELSEIIKEFGEERKCRQIAKKIIEARDEKEIFSNIELANIVRNVYGKYNKKKIDPATKTFQAIRIFVNDELGELNSLLEQALVLLNKGGSLLVVSFHSLEDVIVKKFFRKYSGYDERNVSRYDFKNLLVESNKEAKIHQLKLPFSKAIKPSEDEVESNIRSRSGRLRVAIKN